MRKAAGSSAAHGQVFGILIFRLRWPWTIRARCAATGSPGSWVRHRLLTVVDFADDAFIENADVQSGVGRRGDGVFVTVTLIGVKPGAVGVGCSAR